VNAVGRRDAYARIIAAVTICLLWLYWPELGVVVAVGLTAAGGLGRRV